MTTYSYLLVVILLCFQQTEQLSHRSPNATTRGDGDREKVCQMNRFQTTRMMKRSVPSKYEANVIFMLDPLVKPPKELMSILLTKYYIVHPDLTRFAVITCQDDVTVELNYITDPISSCQVTGKRILDTLKFRSSATYRNETWLNCFRKAEELFGHKSKPDEREKVKKILWIISDGKSILEHETTAMARKLEQTSAEIFVAGSDVKGLSQEDALKSIAQSSDHYACIEKWKNILDSISRERDLPGVGDRVWYSVHEQAEKYCLDGCDGLSRCYCNASAGTGSCVCPPQHYTDGYRCMPCPEGTCKPSPGNQRCTTEGCPQVKKAEEDPVIFIIFNIRVTMKILLMGVAVLAGGLMLIILLCVFVCVACRRRPSRQRVTYQVNSDKVTMETHANQWRRKAQRTNRKIPPPPRAVHRKCEKPTDNDDVIYGTVTLDRRAAKKEILQKEMDGWADYMIEGIAVERVSGLAVCSVDGNQWCRTPGFKINTAEMRAISSHFDPKMTSATYMNLELHLQGKKYIIRCNNGKLLEARGPVGGRSQNIVCAAMFGDFVIVGKSPVNLDQGQCKEEVLRLVGHLEQCDLDDF